MSGSHSTPPSAPTAPTPTTGGRMVQILKYLLYSLGSVMAIGILVAFYFWATSSSTTSSRQTGEKSSISRSLPIAGIPTISAKDYLRHSATAAIPITQECIIDFDEPNTTMGHTGDILCDDVLYKDGEPLPLEYKRLWHVKPVKNSFITFRKN